jgi:hypothetical protein
LLCGLLYGLVIRSGLWSVVRLARRVPRGYAKAHTQTSTGRPRGGARSSAHLAAPSGQVSTARKLQSRLVDTHAAGLRRTAVDTVIRHVVRCPYLVTDQTVYLIRFDALGQPFLVRL